MISFFLKFLWALKLLYSCIYASDVCIEDLYRYSSPLLFDVNVILGEITITMENYPNINVMECLKRNSRSKTTIDISLYSKCECEKDYELWNDNFVVLIRLSKELSSDIRQKKVKSSVCIDKILTLFSDARNLDILTLSNLYLDEVPKAICRFEKLRILELDHNDLIDFEIDSNCLPNLQELILNYNKQLTNISESIINLPSLQYICAMACGITKIPESINKSKSLLKLHLCGNPLDSLPKNFSNIEKLKTLIITNCIFKEFIINVLAPTELNHINLNCNAFLKCLKILIPETSQKTINFEILYCRRLKVEVHVNMGNNKFRIFDFNKRELQKFDYVIKFDPNILVNNPRLSLESEYKFFEYYLDTKDRGQGKTILVREYNSQIKKNLINKNELIAKWTSICKKYNFDCDENSLKHEFEHSITILKKLYQTKITNCSNWKDIIPIECKEKVIKILSNLFNHLEKRNSESQVKEILKLFKEHYSEQLVYFNYLLKFDKPNLAKKRNFLDFFKETIEVLRDDFIILCLNKDERELEVRHKRNIEIMRIRREQIGYYDGNFLPTYDKKDSSEILKFLLRVIMNAKSTFDSGFTIDFVSSIIYNLIQRTGNQEWFNCEMVQFLLDHCEPKSEYFEYETQTNSTVIAKASTKGIEALINLISNRYTTSF